MASNTDSFVNDMTNPQPASGDTGATAGQKIDLFEQQGKTGTYVMGGIITLEEYNPKLINRTGIEQYDIMRLSDPTVHAALTACKLPLQSALWDIKPASTDNPLDQFIADFVEREIMDRNINWNQLLSEMLTVFDFGFSVFEKTYEMTEFEGKTLIGMESCEFRKQRSIMKWETLNSTAGITQILQSGSANVDAEKLLLFSNEREGDNYQGRSILRYAYKPWHMKHNLETIAAVAVERMSIGVPILMPPPNPESGDIQRARQYLREFRANAKQYMELPNGWNVEMMDMKSNSTKDALPLINYCSVNIMKSVLAQFLELGGNVATGSRALSEDHSQFFEKAEEAKANILASSINDNWIQQLCDLNWTPQELKNGYPTLVFSNLGDESLEQMAAYLQAVGSTGLLTPDPELEDHLRQIARFPGLPDEIADNYGERETIQTAVQNAQLGMMTDPALQKGQPGKQKTTAQISQDKNRKETSYGNKGTPISTRTDPTASYPGKKMSSLDEMKAYRQDLINRVMADVNSR